MASSARGRGASSEAPLARVNDATLLEAALTYAAELGWPVFPVDGKLPLTRNGLKDATTDPERIRAWWRRRPDANVAVATGAASGVVVVDADGADGIPNAETLLDEDALLALQVETGGGGRHWFLEHPGAGLRIPNSAGTLAHAVDVRGDGGYVVLPPSMHASGARYRFRNPEGAIPPWRWGAAAPTTNGAVAGLGDLAPLPTEEPTAVARRSELLERLRLAAEGTRNATLFEVGSDLGFLVGAGGLDLERTTAALGEVAVAIGLDPREVAGTVRSGITNGAAKAPTRIDAEALSIAELLDRAVTFLERFVYFTDGAQPSAVALWVVHTHCATAASTTGYMLVTSPAPTSGKTRLAEVVELLVHSPLRASDASPAAIFRAVPLWRPTILLDEMDTKFRAKGDDNAEDLRRLINSGFNRGAYVLRVEGKERTPTKFETFCPKMLIGIDVGAWPDTIVKRSIPIRLQRKTARDKIERFRARAVSAEAEQLRDGIATWAQARADELAVARPELPDELNDRQQDAWEALLAIADAAGPEWGKRARDAAKKLHGALEDETTDAVLLLGHVRDAFEEHNADRLLTETLLEDLVEHEDAPWPVWWESDIRNRNLKGPGARLARMLRPFGIRSKTMRTEAGRGKGYERSQFDEAWSRYVYTPPTGGDKGDSPGRATRDVTTVTSVEGGKDKGGAE